MLAIIAVVIMFVYSLNAEKGVIDNKQKAYRKKWLQIVVKLIGLEIELKGDISEDKQSALWVANHLSWMDIAVVGTQGVGFLSKVEVRKWPLIGWLGEQGGTVFIDRGTKNASEKAAKAIAEKINQGDSILVFPEGTTGTGEDVQRFHARIFAPALDHQLYVQGIAIQYLDKEGKVHQNGSWKDQLFLLNLFGVLAQPSIRAVLTFLPLVDSKDFTQRRKLSEFIERQVRDVILTTKD